MVNQIGTYFTSLFGLSMFGLPVWTLSLIVVATATVVALAIVWVEARIESKADKERVIEIPSDIEF